MVAGLRSAESDQQHGDARNDAQQCKKPNLAVAQLHHLRKDTAPAGR